MVDYDDTDDEGPAITKRTLVREALEKVGTEPCTAREDDALPVVAEKLSALHGVNTVAVVDAEGRLVGIIPMRLLLDELFLDVAPEEFLIGMHDMEDVEEFSRISRAQTAGELMDEPVYVTMDDPVREAFVRMHEHKLEGLPIVDEGMKVVGHVQRLELLRLWVRRYLKGRD